jgi:hypothetical protein
MPVYRKKTTPQVQRTNRLHQAGYQKLDGPSLLLFALLPLLAVSAPGCTAGMIAFPHSEVKYYETEDKTGRAMRIQAWGICLDTNAADASLTVGSTDKTYYFEGPNSKGKHVKLYDPEHTDSYELERAEPDLDDNWDTLQTVALISRSAGIMIHTNRSQIGVSVGLRNHAGLRLPNDFNGTLFLDINTGGPLPGKLYIRKEKFK